MTQEWTPAHDIAVEASGIDPRTQRYPVEEWAPYQRNKWECALRAAQIALSRLPAVQQRDIPDTDQPSPPRSLMDKDGWHILESPYGERRPLFWGSAQRKWWHCFGQPYWDVSDWKYVGRCVAVPSLPETELSVGVVKSDDGKGNDTRIMVKQWSVGVDGPPRITFAIYCGGGHWVEAPVTPEDAMKVMALILDKPVFRLGKTS